MPPPCARLALPQPALSGRSACLLRPRLHPPCIAMRTVYTRALPPDHGVAYIDFAAQKFGITAALSGNHAMIDAYQSGDPYLGFGKQCGALPPNSTAGAAPDCRPQRVDRGRYQTSHRWRRLTVRGQLAGQCPPCGHAAGSLATFLWDLLAAPCSRPRMYRRERGHM
jgi:hypothetical protein